MFKYGIIIDHLGEILGEEMIGQKVKIIDERKADIGGNYYIVNFLSNNFKKYNDMLLAGGGYFNHIYCKNIKVIEN